MSDEILACRFAEDEIALVFTQRHGPEWRYVAKWNRWLYWTGTHWVEDEEANSPSHKNEKG